MSKVYGNDFFFSKIMVLQISSEYQILFMLLNQRGYSDYGEDS